jgi:hypothetical protein
MLDWTATSISARRAGRLLWLGATTVVLVTALAAPSVSAPRSPAGPNVALTRQAVRASGLLGLLCGKPAAGWGWRR